MTSKIVVTQKGLQLQKELEKETYGKPSSPGATKSDFSQRSHSTRNKIKIDTDFLFSTNVKPRGGYFGPKKLLNEVQDSLVNYKPPYYPNYLRKSDDEYPSSHFQHLTPQHALEHMQRSHSYSIFHKKSPNKAKAKQPIDGSVITNRQLPIRYVHHTLFPLTLPDKPKFVQRSDTQPADQTRTKFINTTRIPSLPSTPHRNVTFNIDIFDEIQEGVNSPKRSRLDEFQLTMYSQNNTIVTDHYSKRLVKQYDQRKLHRIKMHFFQNQQKFQETLEIVDEKTQQKEGRIENNMHIAPEFLKAFKEKGSILENIKELEASAHKRKKERLVVLQKHRYQDTWSKFETPGKKKTQEKQKIEEQPIQFKRIFSAAKELPELLPAGLRDSLKSIKKQEVF